MNSNINQKSVHSSRAAFTLVEIMVVVVMIGVLAAIAVPVFQKSRRSSQNSQVVNDFRTYTNAFQQYSMESGSWPANVPSGNLPDEMIGYIAAGKFEGTVIEDALWDWQGPSGGVYGLSLSSATIDADRMREIDALLDDGDLDKGKFQVIGGSQYTLILEEE